MYLWNLKLKGSSTRLIINFTVLAESIQDQAVKDI